MRRSTIGWVMGFGMIAVAGCLLAIGVTQTQLPTWLRAIVLFLAVYSLVLAGAIGLTVLSYDDDQ